MFYHIIIERNEKIGNSVKYESLYEFDIQDLDRIKNEWAGPYKNKEQIMFKGYPLEPKDIRRFAIKSSEKTLDEIRKIQQSKVSANVLFIWRKDMVVESDELVTDITNDVFKMIGQDLDVEKPALAKPNLDMKKIFIVHGHDDSMKLDVARFIEKFEKFSDVGYGIVLYSPCDVGSENKSGVSARLRARQNVVFEHGYLVGKLGRNKVSALVKDNIEIPSDADGIVYLNYDDSTWKFKVCKELKDAGYKVDMNLL
jgi:predicted nucleotide-binding protein